MVVCIFQLFQGFAYISAFEFDQTERDVPNITISGKGCSKDQEVTNVAGQIYAAAKSAARIAWTVNREK